MLPGTQFSLSDRHRFAALMIVVSVLIFVAVRRAELSQST